MTTDELVSRDLATTAAANRSNSRTLAATLRAVGAIREPAPAPVSSGSGLRWLALGEIYASRVARTAAGIAALVSVLVVFAFNAAKAVHLLDYNSAWFGGWSVDVAILLLVFVFLVRIAARGLASAAFARATASPGRIERMVAASDRSALAFGIAGPFAFALVFGVAYFVLRRQTLDTLACVVDHGCWGDDNGSTPYLSRLRDLAIVVPLGVFASIAIARKPPSKPWTRLPAMKASVVLLLATLASGLWFDDGPWSSLMGNLDYNPSPVLRQILMITGSIGLFGLLAGLALWRRAEENARIATTSS